MKHWSFGLALSVLWACITLVLGLLLENLFPISLEQKYPELAYILKQDSDYRIPRLPDGSLLAEDVDRYEKAEEEKMKQFIKEVKKKPFLEEYQKSRIAGQWLSWLPWLVLPFVFRVKRYLEFGLLMSVPLAATIFQLLLPIELFLSAVALVAATLILEKVKKNRSTSA